MEEKAPVYPEIAFSNRIYGPNHAIRKYIGWPDDTPLPITIAHSPHCNFVLNNLWIRDRSTQRQILRKGIFAPSKLHVGGHSALYLPDMEFKRQGTLAMPIHPVPVYKNPDLSPGSELFFDLFEKHIQRLTELPDKFKPVTVRIYHSSGTRASEICEKYKHTGLSYVSSGAADSLFYTKLKRDLCSHEYATSYSGTPQFLSLLWDCKFFYIEDDILPKPFTARDPERFTIGKVEGSLRDRRFVSNRLGAKYKKSVDEVQCLMEECCEDINYKLWMQIYQDSGRSPHFMREIVKKIENLSNGYVKRVLG